MRALLSIKPEHVENIFNGSKTFEFRRKIFVHRRVETVLVYSTKPVGKIVGEFDIEEILSDRPDALWERTEKGSGISRSYFDAYFGERKVGFALKIGSVRPYETPVSPKQVRQTFTPPQSYMYITGKEGFSWLESDQEEMFF